MWPAGRTLCTTDLSYIYILQLYFRFHVQAKKKQAYKTLNYSINTAKSQHTNSQISSGIANDFVGLSAQHVPTYSEFTGQDPFNGAVEK